MRSAIVGGGDAVGGAANAMPGKLIRIRTETVNPSNMAPDIVSFFEFEGIMACPPRFIDVLIPALQHGIVAEDIRICHGQTVILSS
jgi:hypothetical protein